MSLETDSIEFDLTVDDMNAFRRYYFFESRAGQKRLNIRRVVWFFGLAAPVWFLSIARVAQQGRYMSALAAFAITSAFYAAVAWHVPAWLIKGGVDFNSSASWAPGHWRITASADGLSHVHVAGSALMPWVDFNRVEQTPSALYVFKRESALLIPARAFAQPSDAEAFVAYVRDMIARSRRSV